MDQRQQQFEGRLLELCDNVYFQPPPNFKLTYPCFIYKLVGEDRGNADNMAYMYKRQWSVTYITKDVFDAVPNIIALWPLSEFNRSFSISGLHHTIRYIYY